MNEVEIEQERLEKEGKQILKEIVLIIKIVMYTSLSLLIILSIISYL